MDNEIEKLKQDLTAAVDAGLKLAEILNGACLPPETRDAIKTLEALRPKPRLLEGWVRVGPVGQMGYAHPTKEVAEGDLIEGWRVVHFREAAPIPVPEWVEWRRGGALVLQGDEEVGEAEDISEAAHFCDAHNSEMRRLVAAIEKLNAEAGDE